MSTVLMVDAVILQPQRAPEQGIMGMIGDITRMYKMTSLRFHNTSKTARIHTDSM